MPYYDYKCKKCHTVFEKFHSMTETPEVTCPKCSSSAEKIIASSVGIAFKGSGFYVTDNKPSGKTGNAA